MGGRKKGEVVRQVDMFLLMVIFHGKYDSDVLIFFDIVFNHKP